jgi:hypothetical protein
MPSFAQQLGLREDVLRQRAVSLAAYALTTGSTRSASQSGSRPRRTGPAPCIGIGGRVARRPADRPCAHQCRRRRVLEDGSLLWRLPSSISRFAVGGCSRNRQRPGLAWPSQRHPVSGCAHSRAACLPSGGDRRSRRPLPSRPLVKPGTARDSDRTLRSARLLRTGCVREQ